MPKLINRENSKRHLQWLSLCALIVLFACNASAQSKEPLPSDDTQMWSEAQLILPIRKDINLTLSGALRIGNDINRLVYERAGASVSFNLGKYFSFVPIYYYIATQPVAGLNGRENRLSFDGTVRLPVGRFTLSDRNVVELRFRNSTESTRYYNRLQLERQIKFNDVELKLFISDAVYYDWSVNAWSRNRFWVGGGKDLTKNLSLELYYMKQNDSFSRPGNLHAIGTIFKVRL